jgi:hypothetical protein
MTEFNAETQATLTNGYVTAMQTLAEQAIDTLTAEALTWTYAAIASTPDPAVITALAAADGTKPALGPLTLPAFTPAVFTSLEAPVLPAAPSVAGGTTQMWSETFWTNLKSKLTAFTDDITGADDIEAAITKLTSDTTQMQSAMFAKTYEHHAQTLRDEYSAADSSTGARGFTYPNSMTTAERLNAQQKFRFALSQNARDLVEKLFDWARNGYQFAIQQSIAAHGADVEFNVRYLDTTVKVYTATVNSQIEKFEAEVRSVIGQAGSRVQEYAALASAEIDKLRELNDIRLREATFDLAVDKTNADIDAEDMRIQIADFQARVNNFFETVRADLESRDRNVKNRINAAQASAQAAVAMAGGASTITLNTTGA